MSIGLFDPGMTHLHRVGLAGLYMTLKNMDKADLASVGHWILEPQRITLCWSKSPRSLLEPIINTAFQKGTHKEIKFSAHSTHMMSDIARILFHRAILQTYLQHGKTRKLSANNHPVSLNYEETTIHTTIPAISEYNHQKACDLDKLKIFNEEGCFNDDIPIAGWLFPGGAVRHVAFEKGTTLSCDSKSLLSLLFAPVASVYFLIWNSDREARYDKRKTCALVLPHVDDMESYSRCYRKYLKSPVKALYANSLGDAGLTALISLNFLGDGQISDQLNIRSCTVTAFGSVGWSKQQKSRTSCKTIRDINYDQLRLFDFALKTLGNKEFITEDHTLNVRVSLARGLIAENIAAGRDWFNGFHQLMSSKNLAKLIFFEREGLNEMVQKASWNYEPEKLFVQAVHGALKNRYGALAGRASSRGEIVNFEREFERVRASLMRAKNAQTLREVMAALFAHGGRNTTLQENWELLLPLFSGADWQKARDLALLALASYKGQISKPERSDDDNAHFDGNEEE